MEQKDYLQRQIDQLGQVLGRIVAYLLGLKSGSVSTVGVEFTNHTLKSEIDLDLNLLQSVSVDELIPFLTVKKGFSEQNLDMLLEILLKIAGDMEENDSKRESLYKRCLVICEHLDATSRTASLGRNLKMEKIKANI